MNYDELYKIIKCKISEKRFKHITGVIDTSVMLANLYNGDVEKTKLAALLHDSAREYTQDEMERLYMYYGYEFESIFQKEPVLLHSKIGAILAENTYEIKDEEIINAIKFHTTGRKNMELIEKIIFIADYIEPGRNFEGVENIRKQAFRDIDKAVFEALENIIRHLLDKGALIHMDTIEARNDMLLKIKNR